MACVDADADGLLATDEPLAARAHGAHQLLVTTPLRAGARNAGVDQVLTTDQLLTVADAAWLLATRAPPAAPTMCSPPTSCWPLTSC